MALLPPDLTVQVCACLEGEAAVVRPNNRARSVVAGWLSILKHQLTCLMMATTSFARPKLETVVVYMQGMLIVIRYRGSRVTFRTGITFLFASRVQYS